MRGRAAAARRASERSSDWAAGRAPSRTLTPSRRETAAFRTDVIVRRGRTPSCVHPAQLRHGAHPADRNDIGPGPKVDLVLERRSQHVLEGFAHLLLETFVDF